MVRVNDDELSDDRVLWRRILPEWIYKEGGEYRPASLAFIDRRTGEVSVFVTDLTDEYTIMSDYPNESLLAFEARVPRSIGCIIAKTPENPNPAHRVICYENGSAMKRAGKLISKNFKWVRLLPPPLD
jgi:hypothetical protein